MTTKIPQPKCSVDHSAHLRCCLIYLPNRCVICGAWCESAGFIYSSLVTLAAFRSNVYLRLRGGGNRGKGACARRRQRKANAVQKEEGNGTLSRGVGSNVTTGMNGTTIPPYHFQAQEDDGAFSALDRLLDNPVIASFAEKLFADAKFQA
jgi:hypothetical protein